MRIDWDMSGPEIEAESFRRIEAEAGTHGFPPEEWRVIRRMIHTSADFTLMKDVHFSGGPVEAGLASLRLGAAIVCDANMIKAGLSVEKLRKFNSGYSKESIHCHVADADVASEAKQRGCARSLVALDRAKSVLEGGILLVGNAPLALAGVARMMREQGLKPALVIGMPVGFVHVVESKEMIMDLPVPQIVLKGRRGGSALAVAALHGIMETGLEKNSA